MVCSKKFSIKGELVPAFTTEFNEGHEFITI
jgi:hypothetical protein